MNKENIVYVGLKYEENLGDQAIFECTKKMLLDCLAKLKKLDVEIREMDMTGRVGIDHNPIAKWFRLPLHLRVLRIIGYVFHNEKLKTASISYACMRMGLIQCNRFCDENTKAIIFAGGGILKYKYQNFHDYIIAITAYADKHNIPVMISGAGVEGFDADNVACNRLKKALNRNCVRCITTRDDIRTLVDLYCAGNPNVRTALVADPACSMSLYYPRHRPATAGNTIGLGVVREGLFTDNDIAFGKEDMLRFWSALYREIEKSGYKCVLFCNGTPSDERFALDLLQYMGVENKDGTILAERPTSVEMLAGIITNFSAVVTGRLHASIIAYSYGVPCVGLVWNDKQVMFGKAIGCEERFFRVNEFDPSKVISMLLSAKERGYDETARGEYCATTAAELYRFLEETLV